MSGHWALGHQLDSLTSSWPTRTIRGPDRKEGGCFSSFVGYLALKMGVASSHRWVSWSQALALPSPLPNMAPGQNWTKVKMKGK